MSDLKRVYVVSAPSGAGKTTLNRMLCKAHDNVELSVSLTTRPMRQGEVDGRDYFFVDKSTFEKSVEAGDMLEWANVHGNLYGTSKSQLMKIENRGHYALLEIDVQGWRQARKKLKKSTSIFILPPSFKTLAQRLIGRGTDSPEVQLTRIKNASEEIRQAENYDFFIVNDTLEVAYKKLEDIVINKKKGDLNAEAGKEFCNQLIAEYEGFDWSQIIGHKT